MSKRGRTGITVSKEFMAKIKAEYEKRKVELREKGIYSPTQLVIHAFTEWIKKNPPRFEIINHDANIVRVRDREIGMVADVEFKNPDKVFCPLCHSSNCIHIMFVLSQPDVIEALRKRGWKGEIEEII